jgi:hypothetical protein
MTCSEHPSAFKGTPTVVLVLRLLFISFRCGAVGTFESLKRFAAGVVGDVAKAGSGNPLLRKRVHFGQLLKQCLSLLQTVL